MGEEKQKKKMTKDIVPDDFTLSLALVDALPVLFFGASMVLLGLRFNSILFVIGALACFWAGAAKVVWKIIVVTKKKNIWWLFMQMRVAMPAGFILIVIAVIMLAGDPNVAALGAMAVHAPAVVFFALGVVGMVMMGIFAKKLDSSDLRSNWIEQLTNTAAQLCIFIGVLCLM